MANAADMGATEPVRMIVTGYPGGGKTGLLASLANAGYKLRVLDFDGNSRPLRIFTKPEMRKNVDIISLKDNLRLGSNGIETRGIPAAFARGVGLLDDWKDKNPDGTEYSLGRSKDWGCDTVLVLDSLTAMGDAAFRRAISMMNKTPMNISQPVWLLAMREQEAFVEKLMSPSNRFHVIALSHLKIIGPKDIQKDDDAVTKEIKERLVDLVPTKRFPSALGHALPQGIARHFPAMISTESIKLPGKSEIQRVVRTIPFDDLDLKLPVQDAKKYDKRPIETALAEIFAEMAPPLGSCENSVVATTTEEKKA